MIDIFTLSKGILSMMIVFILSTIYTRTPPSLYLAVGGQPMNPPSTSQMVEFWVSKALHLMIRFYIPFIYTATLFDFVSCEDQRSFVVILNYVFT